MVIDESLRIIKRNRLPIGGFAGIVETQMVISPMMSENASKRTDISHGLKDFIYLSTGHFKPNDGAPIHPHKDVDIVSIVLNGAIGHKGSLGNGTVINGPGVQVQRAGTGMEHSEFNLNDTNTDFIQIWFQPPEKGLTPDYQSIDLVNGKLTTVLGGNDNLTFHSKMTCKVGEITNKESITMKEPFVIMITNGSANANGQEVKPGDLLQGNFLELTANKFVGVVVIHVNMDNL